MATAMQMDPSAMRQAPSMGGLPPGPVVDALSMIPGGQASRGEIRRGIKRRNKLMAQRAAMDQTRVEYILERMKAGETTRQKFEPLWQDAYALFLPNRNSFAGASKGDKKTRSILDSTPATALTKWANRRLQSLFPPGQPPVKLKAGIDIPKESKRGFEVMLEDRTETLVGELGNSNAGQELYLAMRDAGICQGAVLFLDDGPEQGFRAECTPAAELVLEEGPGGSVDNVGRIRTLTVRMIERNWPDFEFSPDTESSLRGKDEKGRAEHKLDIAEGCWLNPKFGAWDYVVMERQAKHLGHYRCFEHSPWIVFRDDVDCDEHQVGPYGRGKALSALPDARTLQVVKELVLRNAALAVAGVFTGVDDDVLDVWTVTLEPGAIIPVAKHESLKALELSHDFNVSELIIKDLQTSILETMEATSLPPLDTTVRSATEILAREREAAADSFSGSSRMQVELVRPVARVVANILRERGQMPDLEYDGREVLIDFEGPLASIQKQSQALKVSTFLDIVSPLGEAARTIRMKDDVLVGKVAEALGLWAEAINSDDEVATAKAGLAQQAAILAQLKAGPQLAGGLQ